MAVPPPPLPFFSLLCPWTLSIHSSCALSRFCPLSSRSSSLSAPAGRSRCAQSDGMAIIGCPPLPPIRSQQIGACSEKADGRSGRGSELILLVLLSAASHWATLVVLAYWLKVHTHTKKKTTSLFLSGSLTRWWDITPIGRMIIMTFCVLKHQLSPTVLLVFPPFVFWSPLPPSSLREDKRKKLLGLWPIDRGLHQAPVDPPFPAKGSRSMWFFISPN